MRATRHKPEVFRKNAGRWWHSQCYQHQQVHYIAQRSPSVSTGAQKHFVITSANSRVQQHRISEKKIALTSTSCHHVKKVEEMRKIRNRKILIDSRQLSTTTLRIMHPRSTKEAYCKILGCQDLLQNWVFSHQLQNRSKHKRKSPSRDLSAAVLEVRHGLIHGLDFGKCLSAVSIDGPAVSPGTAWFRVSLYEKLQMNVRYAHRPIFGGHSLSISLSHALGRRDSGPTCL